MQDPEIKKLLEDIKIGFSEHRDDVAQKIEETVKEVVNGKIDRLTQNFNEWKKTETEKRTVIENKLDEYMKTTEPVVRFFTDMTAAKKILFYTLSAITLIGGAWLAIKGMFK